MDTSYAKLKRAVPENQLSTIFWNSPFRFYTYFGLILRYPDNPLREIWIVFFDHFLWIDECPRF